MGFTFSLWGALQVLCLLMSNTMSCQALVQFPVTSCVEQISETLTCLVLCWVGTSRLLQSRGRRSWFGSCGLSTKTVYIHFVHLHQSTGSSLVSVDQVLSLSFKEIQDLTYKDGTGTKQLLPKGDNQLLRKLTT